MNILDLIFWICLAIVFYTYIGYGIVLYIMVKIKEIFNKKEDYKTLTEEHLPEATLLIAAYNEETVVKEKMANCLALNYPKEKLKIIWITDGSNDHTNELLSEYTQVEVLYEPERKGKTAALNRAIDYVKSPIVIFTDANTMINADAYQTRTDDGHHLACSHFRTFGTYQLLRQMCDTPEKEEDTSGTQQGRHDIDHIGHLRRIAHKL